MSKKSPKIVALEIDFFDLESGVDRISLVEHEAIESPFMYFKSEKFESYTDYPDSVKNNAKRGIELNEKEGNKCATQTGKVRAQQLANGEAISVETIKRMYSYLSRAETYYDPNSTTECGTISYLLWGGLSAKTWAESKLKELDLFEGTKEELEEHPPLYTKEGILWDGPVHTDEDGRYMTGISHTEDSEYLYELEELVLEYLVKKEFEQKYIDDLSEDKQDNLLAQLELVGESQEKLEAEGWIIEEMDEGEEFAITSKPNLSSLEDYGKFQIRYKYTGPKDSKNRNFCSKMLSKDLIFRREDINQMTIQGENSEFGIYNIFEFKGSYGCRHYWTRLRMYKGDEGKEITQYEESEDAATSVNPKPTMNRNPNSSTLVDSNFAEQLKEKQLIAGPLMIPNKFIYRYDVYNGEYHVYFSKDTIEKIAYKYLINKHQDSVNLQHSEEDVVDSVTLVESWLVEDPEKDKSYALMGKKYEKGTWFGIMKVENKEVWEEHVKTGKVKGFSVEGFFADKLINASKQHFYYRTTEGGTEIVIDENTSVVFILKDGERTAVMPDGTYELTNGKTLVVVDSKAEEGSF